MYRLRSVRDDLPRQGDGGLSGAELGFDGCDGRIVPLLTNQEPLSGFGLLV